MERWNRTPSDTWRFEAASTLIALACNASLRLVSITAEQIAIRTSQRERVRNAIISTVASIEMQSGSAGFARIAAAVEFDAATGFDGVIGDSWSCVGQVPISNDRFEAVMTFIHKIRDGAVLKAATKLRAPALERESPNIAASAVADVLRDGLNEYARAALLDGFAKRGSPLGFDGFTGEITGRLSKVCLQPSLDLPKLPAAKPPAPPTPNEDCSTLVVP